MKVVAAVVIIAVLGLIFYAKSRPTIVHAKPLGHQYIGFADSEVRWKWDQFQGLRNQLQIDKGTIDPKVQRAVNQYHYEFQNYEKTGEVISIDPKTDLTFLGFYVAPTNRLKWTIVPYNGSTYSLADRQYFLKVRLPNGREYFMDESAVDEPRPHIPGEPGQ